MTLIETERLIIRDWTIDDIEPYSNIVQDFDVMKFINLSSVIRNGAPQSFLKAQAYINKCIENIKIKGWARFANYNNELDFGWRYAKKLE